MVNKTEDLLLRKIHFKRLRKEEITNEQLEFLREKYFKTNDIRYFNELLWLDGGKNLELSKQHFSKQLNKDKAHNYTYSEELKYCLNIDSDEIIINEDDFKNKKVCLIGTPFHFLSAFKKLTKLKVDVDVVNVVYHPNKKVQLLLNNWAASQFYRLYFGKNTYKEIRIKNKSELKNIELNQPYEIGFHKLNFIISDSLIKQFKVGLINDHWGALPLFKGRSTLDYSRLFGAELVITNHLIAKEIDSGPILLYSRINKNKIKHSIYFDLGDRIVKSLSLLCRGDIKTINNKEGVLFYEMHPFLKEHIKKHNL